MGQSSSVIKLVDLAVIRLMHKMARRIGIGLQNLTRQQWGGRFGCFSKTGLMRPRNPRLREA